MTQYFVDYYAYWPDSLPLELNRDHCHSECFGSKLEPFSFGKSEKNLYNTINMTVEEMCFTEK